MNSDVQVALTAAELRPLIERQFGQGVELLGYQLEPIQGALIAPGTRGLFKLIVRFAQGGVEQKFTSVLKIVAQGRGAFDSAGWCREGLVYESGLLEKLPSGLRVPDFYGLFRQPGLVAFFVEYVHDQSRPSWSLVQFEAAAFHLASLATLTGQRLPRGLTRDWLRSWVTYCEVDVRRLLRTTWWKPGLVRTAFPDPQLFEATLVKMLSAAPRLLRALNRLPRVLCHYDAHRRNLMSQRGPDGNVTVMIDLNYVGRGALGEDLGHLASSSLLFNDFDPMKGDKFKAALLRGYASGLKRHGVRADPNVLAFAFATSMALRTLSFLPHVVQMLSEPTHRRFLAERLGWPLRAHVEKLGRCLAFAGKQLDDAVGFLDERGRVAHRRARGGYA